MSINVTKRDGSKEPLDLEKIHKVVAWACEDITGVAPSEVELNSHVQFYNGIQTKEIHEVMIKSSSDLISETSPNYQYVAGRLVNYHLRKEVYGQYEPIHIHQHYKNIVDIGYYDAELLDRYSTAEWHILNNYINHDRDNNITYVGMEQLRGKYLVKNRITNQFYETPQMAFMFIAMTLFSHYEKDRIYWVKELYDALSNFDISLPTPIMGGVRTPDRQFSSCVLIESGDTLNSITATSTAIVKYISQRAGIGIGAGAIRGEKSPIRGGKVKHTGVIPFYKLFHASVKSCSQGALRGGSATLNYMFWHWEIENLLVLKNNKGIEEDRIRGLDYCVHFNKLMYERLVEDGNITLFSPSDVPGLYEAFYQDQDKFRELYLKYERSTKIRKKTIKASELFSIFMQERKDTGRIYYMNVDHANSHGGFNAALAPVRMTNLCCLTGDMVVTAMNTDGDVEDILIKDITTDHKVYSRNIKTGKNEFKPVNASLMTRKNAELIKITDDETNNYIICTPDHLVYTKNRGYVEAQHLLETDELLIE